MSGTEWNRTQGFGVTAGALEAGAKWKKTRGFGICISVPEETPVGDTEVYEGPYVAVPSASEEQTLETEGLLMEEDVVVRRIPYYVTSNAAGGETIYIGSEV